MHTHKDEQWVTQSFDLIVNEKVCQLKISCHSWNTLRIKMFRLLHISIIMIIIWTYSVADFQNVTQGTGAWHDKDETWIKSKKISYSAVYRINFCWSNHNVMNSSRTVLISLSLPTLMYPVAFYHISTPFNVRLTWNRSFFHWFVVRLHCSNSIRIRNDIVRTDVAR